MFIIIMLCLFGTYSVNAQLIIRNNKIMKRILRIKMTNSQKKMFVTNEAPIIIIVFETEKKTVPSIDSIFIIFIDTSIKTYECCS